MKILILFLISTLSSAALAVQPDLNACDDLSQSEEAISSEKIELCYEMQKNGVPFFKSYDTNGTFAGIWACESAAGEAKTKSKIACESYAAEHGFDGSSCKELVTTKYSESYQLTGQCTEQSLYYLGVIKIK